MLPAWIKQDTSNDCQNSPFKGVGIPAKSLHTSIHIHVCNRIPVKLRHSSYLLLWNKILYFSRKSYVGYFFRITILRQFCWVPSVYVSVRNYEKVYSIVSFCVAVVLFRYEDCFNGKQLEQFLSSVCKLFFFTAKWLQ